MKTKIFIGLLFSALILLSFSFVDFGGSSKGDPKATQTTNSQQEQPVGGFALEDGF